MDREEIKALEAIYTNGEKHLTEGEAAEIKAEEERKGRSNNKFVVASLMPFAPFAVFSRDAMDPPTGMEPD
ncbi:hypothetical protein [Paenibacillus sp. MBLB4367]|uniref:hypothetical protein n=1 Tax=Paenibacillus sp. MBLB4367 TaxID=3384767 RepID=UPI003907F6A7